jgi:hypothetical protein
MEFLASRRTVTKVHKVPFALSVPVAGD